MNARCICEKCGKVNMVGTERIIKDWVEEEGTGDKYLVTYYQCQCGCINIVQADSVKTVKTLNELNQIIYRVIRQGATNRDRNRRDKKEAFLVEERGRIREEVRRKNFYKDGKIFIKGLTFSDEYNII